MKKKRRVVLPFHVFNLISIIFPARSHKLRAILLRLCGAQIGKNVCLNAAIRCYCVFIEIGDNTWVSAETIFSTGPTGKVLIGPNCDIGPAVSFICGSHEIGPPIRRAGEGYQKDIVVGHGSWIGARSTILGGAILGNGSIVGAGALVLPGKYPDNVLLCGMPAKIIKELPTQ